MRRLERLRLLAALLAFPAVLAVGGGLVHAQGVCVTAAADAQNELPCRTYTTYGACTVGCGANLLLTCPCFWDDPTNPNPFPVDMGFGSGAGTNCTPETPCCWNKPCFAFQDDAACAIGGGGSVDDSTNTIVEDNCHWFPEEGRCGCRPPLVDVLACFEQPSPLLFAPFDCQCPYLTREEWLAQGGRGACGPPALDHFTFYKAKKSAGAAKFVRFGPVVLSDAFQANAPYEVTKPATLGLPADKNGEGVNDPDTHREEYFVKPVKGSPAFTPRAVRVVNQCSDIVVDVVKPVSLLVPTSKSLTGPVVAPEPLHHNLEHFLCYQAKAQTKLPTGVQVDVVDQFQSRRYDVLKITKVCNAADKAGTPTLLAGPNKGQAKPITPAVRTTPDQHLVCYQMKAATKSIAQSGCGPTTPGANGTSIVPAQPKHVPVVGVHLANQFGTERLDTVKEAELCIPSSVE